ncbi:hypothetical protein SAMN05428982_2186 [Pseudoxanthomonas sp. CF385]|uniref:hypothetical protein n=1 Tax=Pseudoxanthomonas sp. CF385 TaxID=1881042 RepID=UPI00088D62EE|nr:hypothetical protein [Pseudoxanthomonas sp. CF385]SDQ84833.1 hypothetical protein SAMN05428982_2186 [Pseudoxanthomonas sp. CF385]
MPVSRMYRGLSALLLVVAVGGLGWWLGRTQSPDTRASETSDSPTREATPADSAAPSRPLTAGSRPPNRPLPDAARPLREVVADLRARADAGEPDAACRLAAEMEYCDRIATQLSSISEAMRSSNVRLPPGTAMTPELQATIRQTQQAVAAGAERMLEESAHCEGVPAISAHQRLQYWRTAALGGNVVAMRHYAVGNAFRMNETLENLDSLRVYQREAETFAKRAVAQGDLPTVLALAAAHNPAQPGRRHLLAQAVTPDRSQALALYLYAQSLMRDEARFATPRSFIDQTVRNLEQDLDAASLARARAEAANHLRAQPALPAGAQGAVFGHTRDVQRQECGSP